MYNASLVERIDISSGLFIVKIKPDKEIADFIPGQYIALGLTDEAPRVEGSLPDKEELKPGKLIKRAYSIGSAPYQKDGLEFYIAVVPDGALTPRIAALTVGDRLFAAPKIVGTFTCKDVGGDENLHFVSTGTGIAPYISMLRCDETWTPGRSIKLYHGVRYSADLAYRQELVELAAHRPEFEYYPIVSRDDPGWEGERGYVQRYFSEEIVALDATVDNVFVCGNPAMIEDMEELLATRNYTVHSKKNPGKLHVEKYW